LSQQQPNTDKKDPQISVSKSCDMAELETSRPGSQSQMTSTVTEPDNEDTLKNTQEINQPENILHENNNPSIEMYVESRGIWLSSPHNITLLNLLNELKDQFNQIKTLEKT
jgi:hypothetical protein